MVKDHTFALFNFGTLPLVYQTLERFLCSEEDTLGRACRYLTLRMFEYRRQTSFLTSNTLHRSIFHAIFVHVCISSIIDYPRKCYNWDLRLAAFSKFYLFINITGENCSL